MKKRLLNIGIPLTLLVAATFIIGSSCGDPGLMTYRWYSDTDNDGYGAWEETPQEAVNQPTGKVKDHTDCDDTNADVHPGATEIPDNLIDEDCNGKIAITFYTDKDGDGFGGSNSPTVIEIDSYDSAAPDNYSWYAGDCDDNNNAINPLADEIKDNGIDDNCDGDTDIVEYYIDADGDGYGSQQFAAAQGVTNNLDCDDSDAEIHPFTKELLDDNIDNNCDGAIDIIN
ncbi:putative metal-binding motif-containing protein [Lutibacter sp.]|uniref:putative metal-binding motif-containing protein n=1 Tax=Lutibacter sp. TaxID=1925666 RepID=UPI0025BB68A5|nr:putative metal-binding motif-containing protein [Lutibacter sp.]MCF6168274.1 putative metal-binding motif-containing protein [Lutibacter sp.]